MSLPPNIYSKNMWFTIILKQKTSPTRSIFCVRVLLNTKMVSWCVGILNSQPSVKNEHDRNVEKLVLSVEI